MASSAAIILAAPLLYGLYHTANINEKILYASTAIFVSATAFGPIPAFLSERFPTEIRNTASGFVYNGGLIIGSWSPLIVLLFLFLLSRCRRNSLSEIFECQCRFYTKSLVLAFTLPKYNINAI